MQTTTTHEPESNDEASSDAASNEAASLATSAQSRSWSVRVVLGLIWFYQSAISPFTPSACRFRPTCSHYMAEAVARYGARRGSWLGIKRICRCHPLARSGYDPVPDLGADASHEY